MNAFKKTLVLLTFILTVTFTWAQTDIHCNGSGDWDDASNWDLARTPQPGDIVHIDAPGSIVTKSGPQHLLIRAYTLRQTYCNLLVSLIFRAMKQ